MACAELEIGLHRWNSEHYAIDMRFLPPGAEADIQPLRGTPPLFQCDLAHLRLFTLDLEAYGRYLAECLFSAPGVEEAFKQYWSTTQSLDVQLRLRLFIGPSAPELHSLYWEALRLPIDGDGRLTHERLLFSRYLSSADWRPIKLRRQGTLRALVVIANPSNLAAYQPGGRVLAPIKVQAELAQVETGLGSIPFTALASGGQASLPGIIQKLREGYDILYLVAHGALVKNVPHLWLEQADGSVAVIAGSDLVNQLQELDQRPHLIVLASCESAGTGDDGALAALGPSLAEAGIPAVIAMQGGFSMETAALFIPTFFKELQRDGQIDRAVAVARATVRSRFDWWIPALFMRLKSGRLWYVPGFGGEQSGMEKWPALIKNIRRGQCTPIVGPQLAATLLGTSQEIARNWASTYNFPMAPYQCEDLPQVAQFLAVNQQPQFPRDELIEHLRRTLLQRHRDDLADTPQDAGLAELLAVVGKRQREQDSADPYRVLAELPFPIYISTDQTTLLIEALRAAGKDPQVELCRWNQDLESLRSIYDDEPNYRPSEQRPLVYYLFGTIEEPDSLVLTEDDYFDYLIGMQTNNEIVPIVVREALADSALLFLGFRLDDWNFRVLFRSLMSQQGRVRRRRYANIAAQVLPEEGRFLEPNRARRYLESYFLGAAISIFWGSVEDFVRDLVEHRDACQEALAVNRR